MPSGKPEAEGPGDETESDDIRLRLDSVGVALVRSALNADQLRLLLSTLRPSTARGAVRHRSGQTYGARGLLTTIPELAELLNLLSISQLVGDALRRPAFPIDAVFFDKHANANWSVPGHQDVVVPLPRGVDANLVPRRRFRDGLTYGEPPESVLTELVALRIHFDASDEDGGALCVVPGSHLRGRVRETELSDLPIEAYQPCCAAPGDLLLLKPLVIHRSGKSTRSTHRRVLHVLYAPTDGWHGRHSYEAA